MFTAIQSTTNWLMTVISIMTAFGIFMHDGHFDSVMHANGDVALDAVHIARASHVHADYNATDNLLTNSFGYQSPSVPPKGRSERRHHLTLPAKMGRHAFDDGLLPALA